MKSLGVIRSVDRMGRVVIPKEIRAKLNIIDDVDSLEIYMEDDTIVLKKYQPACIFCDNISSIEFEGYNVCRNCIEKLYNLKAEEELE